MTSETSNTSLVVGGTGMLAEAARWLASRSTTTVLIARQASRFAGDDPRYVPADLDWGADAFPHQLTNALSGAPPIARALLWLHHAERDLPLLLPFLGGSRSVLVLGSMDGQLQIPEGAGKLAIMRLGSVDTGKGRRWLTHDEICHGAIAALESGQSATIGEMQPPR